MTTRFDRVRPQQAALVAVVAGLLAGPHLSAAVIVAIAVAGPVGVRRQVGWLAGGVFIIAALFAVQRVHMLEHSRLGPLIGHVYRGDVTMLRPARPGMTGGWTATARVGRDTVLLRAGAATAASVPASRAGEGEVLTGLFAIGAPDEYASAVHAHGTARALRLATTGRRRGGLSGVVDGLRRRSQKALDHGLPRSQAALLRGMVLGDDTALPDGVRKDFRAAGLSHLMAASGQNVVLLVALAVALGGALGVGFTARWAGVVALIVIYVPLAGGGPSIQRAAVMGVAGVAALVAARPASRAYALGLAAAVTLGIDPRAVEDPGWQMSFAAVVGLLALARPWATRLARRGLPVPLAEALAVTAAATLATAPIIALHFGTSSPVTLPANLLAAPVVAPIMWLGMLAAGLGQISPVLAAGLDAAAGPLLGFLTAIAHHSAASPWASLKTGVAPVLAASLTALGLVGRERPTSAGLVVAAAGLSLVAASAFSGGFSGGPATRAPQGLRITFLDVGQGDATLVQDGEEAVLVDSGPPEAPIVARLRHAGVKRLSAMVVTHAEADHEGGAASVLAALPVGMVLDGRDGVRSPLGDRFAATAAARHVPLRRPIAGATLRAGRLVLKVLSPGPGPTTAATGGNPNERAIVLELHDRGATALLAADAESDVLSRLDLGHVDVLKVSHHGSADPGLPALLRSLRPGLAVIEVGAHNSYGHPTPQALAALQQVPSLFRTDHDGSVRADLVGRSWQIHTHS